MAASNVSFPTIGRSAIPATVEFTLATSPAFCSSTSLQQRGRCDRARARRDLTQALTSISSSGPGNWPPRRRRDPTTFPAFVTPTCAARSRKCSGLTRSCRPRRARTLSVALEVHQGSTWASSRRPYRRCQQYVSRQGRGDRERSSSGCGDLQDRLLQQLPYILPRRFRGCPPGVHRPPPEIPSDPGSSTSCRGPERPLEPGSRNAPSHLSAAPSDPNPDDAGARGIHDRLGAARRRRHDNRRQRMDIIDELTSEGFKPRSTSCGNTTARSVAGAHPRAGVRLSKA